MNTEAKTNTEVNNDGSNAFVYTPVIFMFKDEGDRNVRTNWPGVLPRIGEAVNIKGRDQRWVIRDLIWIFDIEQSIGKFQRALVISLEKVS